MDKVQLFTEDLSSIAIRDQFDCGRKRVRELVIFLMIRKLLPALSVLLIITSCSTPRTTHKYELSDGRYSYRQPGEKFHPVYVYVHDQDSVRMFTDEKATQEIVPNITKDEFFIKRAFDVDAIAIPFKYRPASKNLPRQMTTDFNGNVFLGVRLDRFRVSHRRTPIGMEHFHKHRGLSVGAFGGIGAAALTPWTTSNMMNDEYMGFVFSRGFAMMVGLDNLTVGAGIGWDHLTDRDRNIWIYQDKPWFGLTIGLNLN